MPGQDVSHTRQAELAALAASVTRHLGQDADLTTMIPNLSLHRRTRPTPEEPCLYRPNVTVVIQGQKRVTLGEESFLMTPERFLLTSAALPVTPQILDARPVSPFLAVMVTLDMQALSALLLNPALPPPGRSPTQRAMALGETTSAMLATVRRLVEMLETPRDVPILAPLLEQELLYLLLMSPQGERVQAMVRAGGASYRLSRALQWLGAHYHQPLDIEELAEHVGLSVSAFHRAFKEVTALSPLQYQKTLRLSEAQRLMLTQDMDAARAAFEVGYVSASQFSREYRRHFGAPPSTHVNALRPAM